MAVNIDVLFWQDLPMGVKVRSAMMTGRKDLSPRFAAAVKRAAEVAGLVTQDAFVRCYQWRYWDTRNGSVSGILDDVLAEIEQAYSDEKLESLIVAVKSDCNNVESTDTTLVDPRILPPSS